MDAVLDQLRASLDVLQASAEAMRQGADTLDIAHRRYQDLFAFAPDAHLVTERDSCIRGANEMLFGSLDI